MRKKAIITILLAFFALSASSQIHYRIEGNIGHPEFTGIMSVVDLLKAKEISTIEVVNGIITPKEGDLPEMTLCNLNDTTTILVQTDSVPYTTSKLSLSWLFIDNGTTRVEGMKENWLQQSGTPISDEIAAFNRRMDETEDEAAVVYDVISRHTRDVYGTILLVNEGRMYLDSARWIELYDKMMRENGEYISKTPYLSGDLKRIYDKLKAQPVTSVGSMFVDFAVEYEGKTTKLSDYVGKGQYVLVDFWGSWCGACKAAMPKVIALHEKYKDKNFTALGIAVNEIAPKTLEAVEQLKIPFPQILNTGQKAVELYDLQYVPHYILFGPDASVLAQGIDLDKINAKLKEIFGE